MSAAASMFREAWAIDSAAFLAILENTRNLSRAVLPRTLSFAFRTVRTQLPTTTFRGPAGRQIVANCFSEQSCAVGPKSDPAEGKFTPEIPAEIFFPGGDCFPPGEAKREIMLDICPEMCIMSLS